MNDGAGNRAARDKSGYRQPESSVTASQAAPPNDDTASSSTKYPHERRTIPERLGACEYRTRRDLAVLRRLYQLSGITPAHPLPEQDKPGCAQPASIRATPQRAMNFAMWCAVIPSSPFVVVRSGCVAETRMRVRALGTAARTTRSHGDLGKVIPSSVRAASLQQCDRPVERVWEPL